MALGISLAPKYNCLVDNFKKKESEIIEEFK